MSVSLNYVEKCRKVMAEQDGYIKNLSMIMGSDTNYKPYRDAVEYLCGKEWIKDIKEEVDWSKVKCNTKVIIENKQLGTYDKRYFREYCYGIIYCYLDGSDEWSTVMCGSEQYNPDNVKLYKE